MNITHVISSLAGGGAETLLKNILPLYAEKGYDVTLILLSDSNENKDYVQAIEDANVSIHYCSKGSVYNPLLIFKLKRFLKNKHFAHVHLFPTLYWVALSKYFFRLNLKLVYTEHSNKNKRRGKYKFIFKPLDRFMYKQYNTIIGITQSVSDVLYQWNNHKNIRTINNGINTSVINNTAPYTKEQLAQEINVPKVSNSRFILMAGRFIKSKYQKLLIENVLALKNENTFLLLAGTGELLESLKQKYVAQPNIIFLGFRQDIIKLMKSVDLNMLLTEYEGLSGVVLESLAANKPFLGSNVAGVKDIVPSKDFLVENDNEVSLRIDKVLNDQEFAQKQISQIHDHIKKYDIQLMLEEHIKLYKNL